MSLLRMRILSTYGISSTEYGYFHYYSDFLLSILLYFVVASLFQKAFSSLASAPYLRIGSIILAAGVGIFSWAIVLNSSGRVIGRWVIEYSQDIFFIGMLVAVILFGIGTYKSNIPRPIYQLTFVFTYYYCFLTWLYLIRQFSPHWSNLGNSTAAFGVLLPLGVAYVLCDPSIGDSLDRPHSWL